MNARHATLLAGALCLTGCSLQNAGPDQHDAKTIDRDNSELVRANLDLSGGTMRIGGGSDKLLTADFRYGANASKPEVTYSSAAGRGSLIVKQSGSSSSLNHTSKDWDLRLSDQVPMEVEIHLGGGEAHLNLGSLALRNLDVQMGAGELDLDLRGTPKKDYDARVQGGAGEATLRLPSTVGVDAKVQGGIGEINASGFHQDGSRYVNDALGKSPVTIHLDVQGGVGQIKLISE
jgi:hypothetical protein